MLEAIVDAAAVAAGTLVSEDLTCIAAGLLVRQGRIGWLTAVAGCFGGIVLGDLGLWAIGRIAGRRLEAIPWIVRRLPPGGLQRAAGSLVSRLPVTLLASRFLPGARLPCYLAAGAAGATAGSFLLWSSIAAALWTPGLVLLSAWLGPAFTGAFERYASAGRLAVPLAVVLLFLGWRFVLALGSARSRARLAARMSRLWRWEFWPAWLFYVPVAAWVAALALRYRSLTVFTAANPAMPDGGFVGESKFEILQGLPAEQVASAVLIPAGPPELRVAVLDGVMRDPGWSYPVVLKPDRGERGAGVRLVRDRNEAMTYLGRFQAPVLGQVFVPGPCEAGIFYVRVPGEEKGRIFSITEKVFPEVVGDGRHTLEELIWSHPRYRMQARTFLSRLGPEASAIPPGGSRRRLCMAGNHVQGTMFLDGGHLLTPALERAVDEMARRYEGFYLGRFDVRYADPEALKAGRGFTVLELNGVSSESTNIYDPGGTLWFAYRTLFRQWSLLFRIGRLNHSRGHRLTGVAELARKVIGHYRDRPAWGISD